MSPRTRDEAGRAARLVVNLLAVSADVARAHVDDLSATASQAFDTDPSAQRTHALRHVARTAAQRLDAHAGGAR